VSAAGQGSVFGPRCPDLAALGRRARRGLRCLVAIAVVDATACGDDDVPSACGEQDCDLPVDRADLLERLAGFSDPVAQWLRVAANDAGAVDGTHDAWLAGLREQLGCAAADERSFVVLSNDAFEPKVIVTQCANDPVVASRLFTVFEPEAGEDVDAERFRIAAWDDAAARFRRYQVAPTAAGLTVAVEPEFCGSCHGGPYSLPEWTPIMNEMTNPWAQWNAEPGFVSFAFDEFPTHNGPVFESLMADGRLDSASNLEPVVRAAIDRTTAARIAERDGPATLEAAASLVRPVFCDENANYVSEIHDSGELALSAALDPGLRRAIALLRPDATWSFVLDDALQLPAPGPGASPLVLVAVRGETTVQLEAALLSRGVLAPIDVLRVRALDWTHPVGSAARCDRFEAALERANGGALEPAAHADAAALARGLFELALEVPGGSLADVGEDAVVALADAADVDALARINAGMLDEATLTIDALGDAIEAELAAVETTAGRARLADERLRRGCAALRTYPIAPIIPGTDACP
jgi:hypothetical protein